MMAEREANLGVCTRTGDLQYEVAPYEEEWFHPDQANHEAPSEEQCHPGVAPSK